MDCFRPRIPAPFEVAKGTLSFAPLDTVNVVHFVRLARA
jgi:hypothetical protein